MRRAISVIFLLASLCSNLFSEEVSKFRYKLAPETLNNKTISLSSEKVAMAEFIAAGDSSSSTIQSGVASVFFIIDNSASMYNTQWSDIMGERFSVVNALIDSFKVFNPEIEVGVAVFQDNLVYDPADDVIIENASEHPFGFIPLLKLGENYQSTALGNASGYDILKHYMDYTKWGGGAYAAMLKYKNDAVDPKGTNINSGFSAAKQAFNNASYVRESQFIMFLSDGLQEGGTDAYVQGANTPTTFTVYMATSTMSPVPDKLNTMTENIKTNGYSNSNSKSVIKLIEKGEDQVLAWTLENVLTSIFNLYTFIPQNISVNGITQNNWQNGGFTYPELFPLTGEETDFTYVIDYKYYLNNVFKGDTTHTINFTAKVDPAATEENIETRKWGRNLEIFYGGSKITEVTPEMNELEIRFTPYKVDTTYGYSDVNVEVSTSAASSDVENFALASQGAYFSYTFNRESGVVNVGDNKLQLKSGDNLIAVFRNADLPLDTLRIELTSTLPDETIINSAVYYDEDADGHVDSIYIGFTGADLSTDMDDIVSNLELPAFRNFDIDSYKMVGAGLALLVTEKQSNIYTYVTSDDILVVKNDITLSSSSLFKKNAVVIIDSVAPVIMEATLVDSVMSGATDILTIKFSEDVETINGSVPFVFYAMPGNSTYDATLNKISQNQNSAQFSVTSLNGETSIDDGDSIHINWNLADKISDALSNGQDNSKNRRVEIDAVLIEEGIKITEAAYFDANADGYIDSLFIVVYGEYVNENLDAIINAITLPDDRKFEVKSYSYNNGGISLLVNQPISEDVINTAVSSSDILKVKKTTLPNNEMILLESDVLIEDKMAPVIMSASVLDSAKDGAQDFLTVSFSESVKKINESSPFVFYIASTSSEYSCNLSALSGDGVVATFTVNSVSGTSKISSGDSININWNVSTPVHDVLSETNYQDNSLNRKVEILVTTVADGIVPLDAAYFDKNGDGIIDEIFVEIDVEEFSDTEMKKVFESLILPGSRNFVDASYATKDNGLLISVDQAIDDSEINTAVLFSDMLVVVSDVSINSETTLLKSQVSIKDSMAPVILSATLIDSLNEKSKDELIVLFSEEVNTIDPEEPFVFYTYDDVNEYSVKLTPKAQQGNKGSFWIESIDGVEKISDGDSLRINWVYEKNVFDELNNNQDNPDNRMVSLNLLEIPDKYLLIAKSVLFKDDLTLTLPDHFLDIDVLENVLNNHSVGDNKYKGITIITLTPSDTSKVTESDSLSGVISMYDALGNEVIVNCEMGYDKAKNQLIFLWDGKNRYRRDVGSSSCIAFLDYVFYYKGTEMFSARVKEVVGIKK